MRLLVTSDLHLTDRPKDDYRWEIFPWLLKAVEEHEAVAVAVLGDVTDKKDGHSARLVNRIVDSLGDLSDAVDGRLYVLKGNHDYDQDPDCPFFRFLPHFITTPRTLNKSGPRLLFAPHVRTDPDAAFKRLTPSLRKADAIFLHQTFTGALASNGTRLDGMRPGFFRPPRVRDGCVIVSGDIHVPQKVGPILYCGSPYPVAFGDSFPPRVLLLEWDGRGWEVTSIKRETIRKAVVEIGAVKDLDRLGAKLSKGDQVKVRFRLHRRDFHEWQQRREQVQEWCMKAGVSLEGIALEERTIKRARLRGDEGEPAPDPDHPRSMRQVFNEFCEQRAIDPDIVDYGRTLLP